LIGETIFQPDLFVVPSTEGKRPRADVPVSQILLVVEVLSDGSRRHDRLTKRVHYQNAVVPEYWILDQDAGLVERWRPTDDRPEVLGLVMQWQPVATIEPLTIDLVGLFRGVLDD
jgi:Uma2 family endonuclease